MPKREVGQLGGLVSLEGGFLYRIPQREEGPSFELHSRQVGCLGLAEAAHSAAHPVLPQGLKASSFKHQSTLLTKQVLMVFFI